MQKILTLAHGALFADKKGLLYYLTNEQLKKTAVVYNAKTEQNEIVADPASLKLRQSLAVEHEVSKVLGLGVTELALQEAEETVGLSADPVLPAVQKTAKKPAKPRGSKKVAETTETKN